MPDPKVATCGNISNTKNVDFIDVFCFSKFRFYSESSGDPPGIEL
jgi:hypothetical protein